MNFLNRGVVYEVARHEFVQVLSSPLVPVAGLIVVVVSLLVGAGGTRQLAMEINGDALIVGLGHSWQPISIVCTIMAIFLGATIIPYERWRNSLSVLLTKPLYRRDIVLGKFAGLSAFMLLFNTFALLSFSLSMITFFRGPESELEFVLRLVSYIVVLTLVCSLVMALNMLFGVLSKNILFVTAASITYVFFDWIWYTELVLGGPLWLISPIHLYLKIISPISTVRPVLFYTLIPFEQWLSAALPFLSILLIEILGLLLVEIWLFSREDTT